MTSSSTPSAPPPPAQLCADLPDPAALGLVASGGDDRAPVASAFTGRRLATIPASVPTDVHRAVERGRAAQQLWHTAPLSRRIGVLRELRARFRAEKAVLFPALVHGCGLGSVDTITELHTADRYFPVCEAAARAHLRRYRLPRPHLTGRPGARSGPGHAVVTSCTDDARPLMSLLEGALPALLCGSAVVTRLSTRTAVAALRMAQHARAAGLPDGVWQFVLPGSPAAAWALHALLTEHTDARAPQCCPATPRPEDETLAPPGLLVVRHDASVTAAVRAAVPSCFGRAGRPCAATSLIAVHQSTWSPFETAFTRAALHYAAHPASRTALPVINAERGAAWAQAARACGARPVLGHPQRLAPRPDALWHPVVLAASRWDGAPIPPVPRAPLALLVRYTAWPEVLELARHANRHLAMFTRLRFSQLLPQFAGLPAEHLTLNDAPRSGLPPRQALQALQRPSAGLG
ncbi:aldehyde dehydrogenase family protein [Streptomyces natalensis]|uniref:aldehyde dehydrogenase family protein n=1 Tax=Streptomyces natalensis TaxID=68242 RepID=UPI00069986A5|nr:aldehyde dehydrogenase family protein [Streptomyces natalensis]